MFAIAYDFDTDCFRTHYHNDSWQNAYGDVKKFMHTKGFTTVQGSVLYGDSTVTMVTAMMAVAELAKKFSWVNCCVKDIRILQIMENDDLKPFIASVTPDPDPDPVSEDVV